MIVLLQSLKKAARKIFFSYDGDPIFYLDAKRYNTYSDHELDELMFLTGSSSNNFNGYSAVRQSIRSDVGRVIKDLRRAGRATVKNYQEQDALNRKWEKWPTRDAFVGDGKEQ